MESGVRSGEGDGSVDGHGNMVRGWFKHAAFLLLRGK